MAENIFLSEDYQSHIVKAQEPSGFAIKPLGGTGLFSTGLQTEWNSVTTANFPQGTRKQASFLEAFDEFQKTYFRPNTATKPRPQNWNEFITAWRTSAFGGSINETFIKGKELTSLIPNPTNALQIPFNAARVDFADVGPAQTSIGQLSTNLTWSNLGGWSIFDDAPAVPGPNPSPAITGAKFLDATPNAEGNGTINDRMNKAFFDTFAIFVTSAEFPNFETPEATNQFAQLRIFFDEWREFLIRTTRVQNTFTPGTTNTNTPNEVNLQTFERIYNGYFPPEAGTSAADQALKFKKEMIAFADSIFDEEGYFYPNHFVERWTDVVKDAAARKSSLLIGGTTVIEDDRLRQARILNEVFELLTDMIGVIQQATIALSRRLRYFSDYQRELTKLTDQMPVFFAGDGTPLGQRFGTGPGEDIAPKESDDQSNNAAAAKANSERAQKRSNLVTANQAKLETLRAHRDIVGDETKQLQTTVNQLNDAAAQQGNIATAILQQLSGILTLIFR